MIKCLNRFCIYNNVNSCNLEGICMLDSIELSNIGTCDSMTLVDIDESFLKECRGIVLAGIEKRHRDENNIPTS